MESRPSTLRFVVATVILGSLGIFATQGQEPLATAFQAKKRERNSMKMQKQTNLLTQRALAVDEALDERAKALAAADSDFHRIDRAPTVGSLLRILHGLGRAYRLGRERYRQRRQLMGMDNRELKDIGITREQAEEEARKPIWKG
jgi:uncharacterized protein YjiS (DUF1127 family)